MAPEAKPHRLTALPKAPPQVHGIFVESTQTWQYVIADLSTNCCIVIDPVRDHIGSDVSMAAAESIVALVKKQYYTVDYICETASSNGKHLSAAWFLRMQFADMQGRAPHLSNEATVASIEDTWRKRHSTNAALPTNLPTTLADGGSFLVGNMPVRCLRLPTAEAPSRRAFIIGDHVFGAHSLIAQSQPKPSARSTPLSDAIYQSQCAERWDAIQRIAALPPRTLLYKDMGDINPSGDNSFDDLGDCKDRNHLIELSAEEYVIRMSREHQTGPLIYKPSHGRSFSFQRLKARLVRSRGSRIIHTEVGETA